MDELDFLKSHWQKDNEFPQVKAEDIRKMLHRSSSSIVKWIFIISIIELFAGLTVSLLLGPDEKSMSPFFDKVYTLADIVFYPIVLYFIYQFFTSFKNIRNTTSTRTLMEAILTCRKHVHHYIKFNVYFIFIGFVVIGAVEGYEKSMEIDQQRLGFYITVFAVSVAIAGLLFLLLINLYYRLLYGILLKKLNKNYEELLALDKEVEEE